jgi:hypothetical protein
VDFEALIGHDHSLDQQAKDPLLRREISGEETRPEAARDVLGAKRAAPCHFRFEVLGLEGAQMLFRRLPSVVDRRDSASKHLERQRSELIRVGEAISLPGEIVEACDGALHAKIGVGGRGGGLLRPRAECSGHRVGIQEEIADGGPDGLVHALDMQSLVDAARAHRIGERRHAHTAEVIGVCVLAPGPAPLHA